MCEATERRKLNERQGRDTEGKEISEEDRREKRKGKESGGRKERKGKRKQGRTE